MSSAPSDAWTQEERERLAEAVAEFSCIPDLRERFQAISEFVGTRKPKACASFLRDNREALLALHETLDERRAADSLQKQKAERERKLQAETQLEMQRQREENARRAAEREAREEAARAKEKEKQEKERLELVRKREAEKKAADLRVEELKRQKKLLEEANARKEMEKERKALSEKEMRKEKIRKAKEERLKKQEAEVMANIGAGNLDAHEEREAMLRRQELGILDGGNTSLGGAMTANLNRLKDNSRSAAPADPSASSSSTIRAASSNDLIRNLIRAPAASPSGSSASKRDADGEDLQRENGITPPTAAARMNEDDPSAENFKVYRKGAANDDDEALFQTKGILGKKAKKAMLQRQKQAERERERQEQQLLMDSLVRDGMPRGGSSQPRALNNGAGAIQTAATTGTSSSCSSSSTVQQAQPGINNGGAGGSYYSYNPPGRGGNQELQRPDQLLLPQSYSHLGGAGDRISSEPPSSSEDYEDAFDDDGPPLAKHHKTQSVASANSYTTVKTPTPTPAASNKSPTSFAIPRGRSSSSSSHSDALASHQLHSQREVDADGNVIRQCLLCCGAHAETSFGFWAYFPCNHFEICAICFLKHKFLLHKTDCPLCIREVDPNDSAVVLTSALPQFKSEKQQESFNFKSHFKIYPASAGDDGDPFSLHPQLKWNRGLGCFTQISALEENRAVESFRKMISWNVCPLCPEDVYCGSANTREELAKHIREAHTDGEGAPICVTAGGSFSSAAESMARRFASGVGGKQKGPGGKMKASLSSSGTTTNLDETLCPLCVEHQNDFPALLPRYRRGTISRNGQETLGQHMHLKHVLCHFCDEKTAGRFYSATEALRHLRDAHEKCIVCDKKGLHNCFFENYDALWYHYNSSSPGHYICRETKCYHRKTCLFQTEYDLLQHEHMLHGGMARPDGGKKPNPTANAGGTTQSSRVSGSVSAGAAPAVVDITREELFPSLGAAGAAGGASSSSTAPVLGGRRGVNVNPTAPQGARNVNNPQNVHFSGGLSSSSRGPGNNTATAKSKAAARPNPSRSVPLVQQGWQTVPGGAPPGTGGAASSSSRGAAPAGNQNEQNQNKQKKKKEKNDLLAMAFKRR